MASFVADKAKGSQFQSRSFSSAVSAKSDWGAWPEVERASNSARTVGGARKLYPRPANSSRKSWAKSFSSARSSRRLVSSASDFFGFPAIDFDHRAGEMLGFFFRRQLAGEPARFGGPARAVGHLRVIQFLPLAGCPFHDARKLSHPFG